MLRAIGDPVLPNPKELRVVGIDEFAFRKGHQYGTILVDLENREVVDLLPDRNPDTVAAWLQAHPEVEIISRDRSNSFADAARRGAPKALQVTDRWHLLKNMTETLSGLVSRSAKLVKAAATAEESVPEKERQGETQRDPKPTKAQVRAFERRERRLERYHEIHRLRSMGMSERRIAAKVGLERKTVRRFLRADEFPERVSRNPSESILDSFKAYLFDRWQAGCHNAAELYREIKEKGYQGRATTVRKFLSRLRPEKGTLQKSGEHKPVPVPSVRRTAYLLSQETLEEPERSYLSRLFALSPMLEKASSLARRFMEMVKGRRLELLGGWMEEAEKSGIEDLSTFSAGLERDRKAIEAALTLPWSNGQVEGQVNRLKAIKRQMYGRAKFDLLRKRVLKSAA